jgi:hypothetical protein
MLLSGTDLDKYFCEDIIKQGKRVLALEFVGFIVGSRVSYGDLSRSYQERPLPTEPCRS